jgi:glutamate N-acetyltransferase/amino-acid N-acetyltransferase
MGNATSPTFLPIRGLRLGCAAAGIRYQGRNDLVAIELPAGAACAAVFTRNAFCAAPVVVARENRARTAPRYLVVNSGNANAGTGEAGLAAARESCRLIAAAAGCDPEQVLPFSTGVIGEPLPVERIGAAAGMLLADLAEDGWERAADAIMTTDTVRKLVSREVAVAGRSIRVTGMAKGAGMIRPDMATMLAYVATDAAVDPAVLQRCLEEAVEPSFNAITIDGDTSTNDACVLMATGGSGVAVDRADSAAGQALFAAVRDVCMALARAIVKDGEGATKLVEILVEEAADRDEARAVAYTIAHSPLVKTALFASDPNWGRILAAVGRAGLRDLDIRGVRIWLDDVRIVREGGRDPAYTEAAGKAVVARPEFTIRVALGRGATATRVLTCDLSFDYVKINAEYRT